MLRLSAALVTSVILCGSAVGAQTGSNLDPLAEARSLLESEQPIVALRILEPIVESGGVSAEALLLTSTAHFMLGNTDQGLRALEQSIQLDPTQRQAWLNRAAVDLAGKRYDEAIAAFTRARELDPTAPDNDINLGATLILKGEVGGASRHFNRYLSRRRSSADAYYLVASNYALGQHWELATRHLEAAIRLDEKSRRRSRTDPNFGPLADYEPFRVLLATDSYQPGPQAHLRVEAFDSSYDGGHGKLLTAVLNALQFSAWSFDPNVEVTDHWALIWGDLRLKVTNSSAGGGEIEMTAPAASHTAQRFAQRTAELIGQINEQLARLSMRRQ